VNAAAGAPDLAATLQFIEDKLNDNGAVSFRVRFTRIDGRIMLDDPKDSSQSRRTTQASADPSTCQVRFNQRTTRGDRAGADIPTRVSFRRLEKLEVATHQDFEKRRPSNTPGSATLILTGGSRSRKLLARAKKQCYSPHQFGAEPPCCGPHHTVPCDGTEDCSRRTATQRDRKVISAPFWKPAQGDSPAVLQPPSDPAHSVRL
jgi:hypothetical protein